MVDQPCNRHCFHWSNASETFNTPIEKCCECDFIDFPRLNDAELIIKQVRELADRYADKADETNPNGYGGQPLDENNSISYWLVSRELWKILNNEKM